MLYQGDARPTAITLLGAASKAVSFTPSCCARCQVGKRADEPSSRCSACWVATGR